jgi:ATP-binding cassette subfamily B (MDR/TAP) protein 1
MDHQAKEGDPANCGIGVQEPEPVQHAEWKELFNFTTRTHIPYLAIGLCLSVITGMIIPALALFLGDIFDDFTSFDAGTIDGADLVGYVSTKALWLLWLGLASWILNASYFMFWLSFGELQARSVRDQLFEGMLQRDMEWFDMRKAGVHATIARFQT